MSGHVKVAVIGLGYVGSCLAATLADRGWDVVGVDTDTTLIEELRAGHVRFKEAELEDTVLRAVKGGKLTFTTDPAETKTADVVLVTVGTPVDDDGALDDRQLLGACRALSEHLRDGQMVVLKSTVPPGTTRNVVLPVLERSGLKAGESFDLAFSPERLAEGTALRELRTFPIVVGAIGARGTERAAAFWREALDVEVLPQESVEAAEIVKLADNWWIDLNIALANEMARYCALFGVDVLDVINAANTIPKGNGNVNILMPSVGVGGSCLVKDPLMVSTSARGHGVEIRTAQVSRAVNDDMPHYAARLVVDELAAAGKEPAGAVVAVLGLAFKNNTGDLRSTPVEGVVRRLLEAGCQVRIFDPLVDPVAAERLFGLTPSSGLDEAVRDADCVAVLALHREFEGIDFATLPVRERCVLLDGRAYYSKEQIAALRRDGYVYRGIGR
ncbi:nucleotide sugar dehydrogenase [Streptomyces sp. RerS4]|uniref:nucleotide sugar dehydrogenase n=1 Tax=Streptomyces sp. RerS4 TaxID=2942449 RepID=UPI00201C85CB|nr:nucleotide sugar dehydrogenase [Streptomyces sp. RerS4]UQX03433.1 nucleotide sugar dehydrogenase [Streptomyces sp. RerS4]